MFSSKTALEYGGPTPAIISGGLIQGGTTGISCPGGTVKLLGGTVVGATQGIALSGYGKIEVGGLSPSIQDDVPLVSGGQDGVNGASIYTVTFNNGKIRGTNPIDSSSYKARAGYGVTINSESDEDETTYNCATLTPLTTENYWCVNKAAGYSTLGEAYQQANSTDTIGIMNDNITDTSTVEMNSSKTITLQPNVNNVTYTNPIQLSNGSLTIDGPGTIKNTNSSVINISNGRTLTIRNGTLESTNNSAIYENGSSSTITIGNSSDTFNTENPKITGQTYGINSDNISSCKINMYHGIIRGKTHPLTDNAKIEDTAGTTRQMYVAAEIYTDLAGYNCLTLRPSGVTITSQPRSLAVALGESATLSVGASAGASGADLTYQWYKSDTEEALSVSMIENGTLATLTIMDPIESDHRLLLLYGVRFKRGRADFGYRRTTSRE